MLLRPNWPAPPGVLAACSTRQGGVSAAPFDSNNLANGIGDSADAVAENRRRFAAALGATPRWLRLVHGTHVHRWCSNEISGLAAAPAPTADAAWTTEPGIACTVSAADCLPVLFALRDGSAVAAAHAGWRGLAAGVLEATLAAVRKGTGAAPADFVVWLGPCIGPLHFEVGADVLAAFGQDPRQPSSHFRFKPRSDGAARWLAHLPHLAQQRLVAAGVQDISSSGLCTVSDPSRFFSFRRDGRTGRFVAAIFRR
jgi:polyphenol oxidase